MLKKIKDAAVKNAAFRLRKASKSLWIKEKVNKRSEIKNTTRESLFFLQLFIKRVIG